MNDITKDFCLLDELDTAHKLIVAGLGDLQEIDMGNDFYHLPHQLLASGLERLMKCYICLVHEARNGSYPNTPYMKNLGHDLSRLSETIEDSFFAMNDIPQLKDDHSFLKNDELLKSILHILSKFGKLGRYHNLNVVTGMQALPIDPREEWEAMESRIEDMTPYLGAGATEVLMRDYYPRVNSQIIAKLERFIRAIAMQFTLGQHGGKLQQYSVTFTTFRNITNEKLGTTDYRRSVNVLKKQKDKWVKRTEKKIQDSRWPTKTITQSGFTGDWPFRAEHVVIECRESMFCVVNIQGYDFALNGAAASRYSVPFPHDAGMAVIGKSVGPFISMALDLGGLKE